jgi:hypothetical protein
LRGCRFGGAGSRVACAGRISVAATLRENHDGRMLRCREGGGKRQVRDRGQAGDLSVHGADEMSWE